jgi:hypothetical protein
MVKNLVDLKAEKWDSSATREKHENKEKGKETLLTCELG